MMQAQRRRGLSMTFLGLGLLAGALLLNITLGQLAPRPSGPHLPVPSATALRHRIASATRGFRAAGETSTVWVGQQVNSVGGFTTRYATYVDIVQKKGHIVFWGTGRAVWNSPDEPYLSLVVHPVYDSNAVLYPIGRPQSLPEKPGAHWFEGDLSGSSSLIVAHNAHGVWVWMRQHGHMTPILAPWIFHNG